MILPAEGQVEHLARCHIHQLDILIFVMNDYKPFFEIVDELQVTTFEVVPLAGQPNHLHYDLVVHQDHGDGDQCPKEEHEEQVLHRDVVREMLDVATEDYVSKHGGDFHFWVEQGH